MLNHKTFWRVALLAFIVTIGIALIIPPSAPDFSSITDTKVRKKAFINYLKPAIEDINQERVRERQALKSFYAKLQAGESLSFWQRWMLKSWARRYKIDYQADNLTDTAKQLLLHLDKIPASMVLAQAAIESAWGTSRFVKEANNYFGQWCFKKGCGIVPRQRNQNARHEVKEFDSLEASLYSYFQNINGHAAYEQVREIRAQARENGKPLSGLEMVRGLENYSGRGHEYIDELQSVIHYNRLE